MDFNTFLDRSKLFAIEASSNHLVGAVDIDIKNFITSSVHCKNSNNKEQATEVHNVCSDEGLKSPGTKMIELFHQTNSVPGYARRWPKNGWKESKIPNFAKRRLDGLSGRFWLKIDRRTRCTHPFCPKTTENALILTF